MLNIPAIETSMRKLGLNGAALAEACLVSREAASNWLKGESIPRPSKLAKLANALQLSVEDLLKVETVDEPLFAYRTKQNRPVTGPAREAAEELARHLKQVLPYVEGLSEFEPPLMRDPSIDDERVLSAARAVRASLRLAPSEPLTNEQMIGLFHSFGALLVPVLWGQDKEKHENALTVYLPNTKTSWVVFNLGCKQDDYKYWLAHEYGHCLTLHELSEDDGEKFAEAFAQHLLFPPESTHECLEALRAAPNALTVVESYAKRHDISVVTVIKAADRLSLQLYGKETGLASRGFWQGWSSNRVNVRSIAHSVFGTDSPSVAEYLSQSEAVYKSPVFGALAAFQRAEGGRDPAFIANTLKISLAAAVELSHALWQR